MQIILIGNYPPDKQESMERFAKMLSTEFSSAGYTCAIWRPKAFLGTIFKSKASGLGKWFGYFDKWILFPVILKWRIGRIHSKIDSYAFYICDHSNAPYLKHLPPERTVITCHDVLAIMGALGYKNTFCEPSRAGQILQKWILKYLSSATKLAAVSQETLMHLEEITSTGKDVKRKWQVIYNGFNDDFKPVQKEKALEIIKNTGINGDSSFLLHVGSDLPRKNRKLLIDMAALLVNKWDGKICFAGSDVDSDLLDYAATLGLKERIITVVKPNHEILTALYSGCEAFIFPSYSEGFGWPVIEAQACGAPVIASNIQPMPEISGGAALHHDPNKPQDFADAFMWMQDKKNRLEIIKNGFENSKRFNTKKMALSYLELQELEPLNDYKCC